MTAEIKGIAENVGDETEAFKLVMMSRLYKLDVRLTAYEQGNPLPPYAHGVEKTKKSGILLPNGGGYK